SLIYEPANLELCGQEYGPVTIEQLAPWMRNVYLQNHVLKSDGNVTLNTWCRGPVRFDLIPIHAAGGIDFANVFQGLASVGYRGPVTAHQSGLIDEAPSVTARATAQYLRALANTADL
ncbi:MAG: sugar phosphate isomerase/epimerase, partial [Planctomycetaceae bacterium]